MGVGITSKGEDADGCSASRLNAVDFPSRWGRPPPPRSLCTSGPAVKWSSTALHGRLLSAQKGWLEPSLWIHVTPEQIPTPWSPTAPCLQGDPRCVMRTPSRLVSTRPGLFRASERHVCTDAICQSVLGRCSVSWEGGCYF